MNKLICFTLAAFLLSGCIGKRSIMSFSDKSYFKEPPKIVTIDDKYFVRFVYSEDGSYSFFMMTSSKIKGDKLLFFIPATSSSGAQHGQVQYEAVHSYDKISLIRENQAYWVNPDHSLLKLRIEPGDKVEFDRWGKGNILIKH